MESFRLRLKVGAHEFEAEGDQETVERQLAVWRDLIASIPVSSPSTLPSPPPAAPVAGAPIVATPEPAPPLLASVAGDPKGDYAKLFRHEGEIVSLSIHPNGGQRDADAALLILLGQSVFNNEDQVSGYRVLQGMARSGLPADRADRVFGDHMAQNVIRFGAHRGVKYRLTNPGITRAREIAKEMLERLP